MGKGKHAKEIHKFKKAGKKQILIAIIFMIVAIGMSLYTSTLGMQDYEKLDFVTGIVTASSLNVREGPGLNYKIITRVDRNEYVRVFAKIGNWYVIQTDEDFVGMASRDYIKPIYPQVEESEEQATKKTEVEVQEKVGAELTNDEKETLELINQKRKEAGLAELVIDSELQNVARIKAKDMVDNNYFSHTSPTYGSPFDMIKSFKISYRTAGENIAGNSKNSGAVEAWMNSEGHKANILNNSYNYTGLAVISSPKYGKIYVQMFIGR